MIHIKLLKLHNFPILKQLYIEETLLRTTRDNWCIINSSAANPAIIMGISSKPKNLINIPFINKYPIPIIRRFSGGGTVVVDKDTFFVTFIINSETFDFQPLPKYILEWTKEFYSSIFGESFNVQENDYVFGDKKFGGNAQYIVKDRWLHHTSFLWDYDKKKMRYLKKPEKQPQYRKNRSHSEFLCCLKNFNRSRESILYDIENKLNIFQVNLTTLGEIDMCKPHRKTTTIISSILYNTAEGTD